MKVRDNRLYIYPVLSKYSSDFVNNKFDVEIELYEGSDPAVISLTPSIEDLGILDLLKENKVGFYCHVECPVTKYRELFSLNYKNNESLEITIPLSRLNEDVEIVCLLIANENISGYDKSAFSELHSIANYPQYATVGFTETVEFSLTKKINVNGDIPSIFSIIKKEDALNMSCNMFDDIITIYLPKDEYGIYFDYVGTNKRIKQLMINLPVLVEALDMVKNDAASVEGFGWYKVIENALKAKGFIDGFSDNNFVNTESVIIGQMLLGNLIQDAFKEFDDLNKRR